MPRTVRSSFSATAIGHSSCRSGVPSGQNSFQEPHHSLEPSIGPVAPKLGGRLVVIGDPAGGVGRIDRGGQRIEQFAEPAIALAQRRMAAVRFADRHDILMRRAAAGGDGAFKFAFQKTDRLIHSQPRIYAKL